MMNSPIMQIRATRVGCSVSKTIKTQYVICLQYTLSHDICTTISYEFFFAKVLLSTGHLSRHNYVVTSEDY